MVDVAQAIVREAQETDLPRIMELYQQLASGSSRGERPLEPLGEGQRRVLAKIAASPDYHLLVAELDGRVIGTATLYLVPDLDLGGTVWGIVEHVVVQDGLRGRGYGEAVMREIMRRAQAAGCQKLSLNSGNQRHDTHRFYERIGFQSRSKGFSYYF
jgi:GNAT superfamily N-acetyltransferase